MPHCDTLNGPVVLAAKKALESGNINYVLIWLPAEAEGEIKRVFEKVLAAREYGNEAQEAADFWFYETAVRLHRAGEGEGFTGLKPEGKLDPIVQQAEQSIGTGDAHAFIDMIEDSVEEELKKRFERLVQTKDYAVDDVEAGRKYIEAYIGCVVFSHHLYEGLHKNHHLDEKSKHEH